MLVWGTSLGEGILGLGIRPRFRKERSFWLWVRSGRVGKQFRRLGATIYGSHLLEEGFSLLFSGCRCNDVGSRHCRILWRCEGFLQTGILSEMSLAIESLRTDSRRFEHRVSLLMWKFGSRVLFMSVLVLQELDSARYSTSSIHNCCLELSFGRQLLGLEHH